jgi:hypothetical protein
MDGMSAETPTFAVVGAVNHGKSSVVSTLAENDQVRISSMPGETVDVQRFWLLDLSVFIDTPGFQNALAALEELKVAEDAERPLDVFREFIARHRSSHDFDAELRLLQPIVDGAGIVYVVDASEPLLELHKAEMKILKLTGRPRMAIINRTGDDDYSTPWKRELDWNFNVVREFNAHGATFDDRIRLLRRLAGLAPAWERQMEEAVARYEAEWRGRMRDASEIIAEMLSECLAHDEQALLGEESARAELERELIARFQRWVVDREARAHREIIELFRHRLVQPEAAQSDLFEEGLFSDRTWSAFGCSEGQLVVLGAMSGAALGVIGDVALGGHSLGIFAAGGAVAGASTAFLAGKARPEFQIEMPRRFRFFGPSLKVAGTTLRIPPYRAVNFPWILIDRALAAFHFAIHRAHARRDPVRINSAAEKEKMARARVATEHWPEEKRRACQRIFNAMRERTSTQEQRAALREVLRERLAAMAMHPESL